MRAVHGDVVTWGPLEYLTAGVLNAVNGANWQRAKKGPRPKPVKPPARRGDRFGTPRPVAEMRERLDAWKAGQLAS